MYPLIGRIRPGAIEVTTELPILHLRNSADGVGQVIETTAMGTDNSWFHCKFGLVSRGEDEKRCDGGSPRPLGFLLSISQPTNQNPHRPPSPLTPIDPPPLPWMSHKKSPRP